MSSSNSASGRYSGVAVILHWLLAVALAGVFFMGLYMTGLKFSPTKLKLINWHKWLGIAILVLSVLRLVWRVLRRPPPLSSTILVVMPKWQRVVHHGVQHLMYLLFFAVPFIGWAYSSAAGFQVVLFGQWPLPNLLPVDKALAAAVKPWHAWTAFALAALVVVHVAAAFKHQWIDRDGLLSRMLPWG